MHTIMVLPCVKMNIALHLQDCCLISIYQYNILKVWVCLLAFSALDAIFLVLKYFSKPDDLGSSPWQDNFPNIVIGFVTR